MKNLKIFLNKYASSLIIFCIRVYQVSISPDHGIIKNIVGNNRCKFFPSCSEYIAQSIRQYGLTRGVVVSCKRIARCRPGTTGGYDPVSSRGR